jgi:uncharacterized damage-inducible protein DinB
MLDREYVRLMAEYNQWMNEKLYDACAKLDDAQRTEDRGAFFGSIHNTLNHLLWGDRAFLARLLGWNIDLGMPRDVLFDDFVALRRERTRLDEILREWAKTLEEGSLDEPIELRSVAYQRRRRIPRFLLVVQMFNHQTHHRGQLTTLLSQRGIDIGVTDLPFSPYADEICQDLPFAP